MVWELIVFAEKQHKKVYLDLTANIMADTVLLDP